MGNICGSPDSKGASLPSPKCAAVAPKQSPRLVTSTNQDKDEWKTRVVTDTLALKGLHPCEIVKFKTGQAPVDQYEDDSEDENKWFCNGGDEEEGFVGGCKSG